MKKLNTIHGNDWSLAILFPSNSLMMEVSEAFNSVGPRGLPSLKHELYVNTSAIYLSAILATQVLEDISVCNYNENRLIKLLINYLLGKKESGATKKGIDLADGLKKFLDTGNIRGKNRILLVNELKSIAEGKIINKLSGNPLIDWKEILRAFSKCESKELNSIYNNAKLFTLIKQGGTLFKQLNDQWLADGTYLGAVKYVEEAIQNENFSSANRSLSGILLMTIHKSKGKEFNEVIIYEGVYDGKYLYKNAEDDYQSRMNLRVGATRAKEHVLILTPKSDPCSILFT
jgi:DNA helicase-2/ATP-dependent DNA helicase PcrA